MKFKGLIKKLSLVLAVLTFLLPGRAVFAGGEEITPVDMANSNCKFVTMLLDNVDPALGLEKSEDDGNLLKKGKLTQEEQSVYDDIKKEVDGLVDEAESDAAVLSSDVKKTKAIYNWIFNKIAFDYSSLNPSTCFDFDKGIGGKVISENPDRKAQDVISVYKDKKAVCAGRAFLFELMMRMAGLPCVCLANGIHAFNAAWLDRGDGKPCWMLIDVTAKMPDWPLEDNVLMFAEGQSVEKPRFPSLTCNIFFTSLFEGDHYAYFVSPPMTELRRDLGQGQEVFAGGLVVIDDAEITEGASIYCRNGFDYAGAFYDRKSSTSQVFALPKGLICLHKRWKLAGDFKSIKDLDFFVKKGICLDIAGSAFEKVVEKDGVEFEIYGGGFEPEKDSEGKPVYADGKLVYPKSILRIKSKNGVSVSEVEIPEELKVFVGDVGVISVESDSIKTVKYSLLKQCDSLKEGVELSAGVNFENVTKPSENV